MPPAPQLLYYTGYTNSTHSTRRLRVCETKIMQAYACTHTPLSHSHPPALVLAWFEYLIYTLFWLSWSISFLFSDAGEKKLLQQVPYTHSRGRSLCNVSECSHGGVLHLFRFFVCSNPAKCDFSFFFVYGAQSILISTSAIQVYFFCYRFWLFLVVVLFALLLLL